MQEREQRIVVLVRDSQIVEPALSRSQPVRLEPGAGARQLAEQRAAAGPEQRRMPELILGVAEVEPSQQGIAGQLRRAGQIAPAVRLGLREAQELARAAVRISPDPAVQRAQRAIERGGTDQFTHASDASTG